MIKESLCLVCGTFIVSVTADISVTEVDKSGSSYWYEDLLVKNKSYQIWILSILASCTIGFCGILPLVIIPLDSGAKQNQKGDSKLLRLLLSFAVGGLLGDVFLHLLPEAWNHIEYLGPELHNSHLILGLWVLLGMFSFVVLEMMFSNPPEKEIEGKVSASSPSHLYSEKQQNMLSSEIFYNGNSKHSISCSDLQQKPMQNGCSKPIQNGTSKDSSESLSPIHVTGYLNLMANSIDNFTHGLAVAASFLVGTKMGLLTTFAILLHEIPHEFGDFAILLKSGFKPIHAVRAQISTASLGILGAVVALSVESADKVGACTLWILPFTSGGFLNIALVNVLPDLLKEKDPWESMKQMACLCGGIGVMALVNVFVH